MVWNFNPPVYKYCHYCCLPPTGPTSHSVPSSLLWQIFLHLFCLATHISIPTDVTWPLTADCNTLGKTRTLCKGKTTPREVPVTGGPWPVDTGWVREEAGCVLISHPIVPKPAAGMLSSPIIPSERFLPCPRTPPFPHRTSTWDRAGSSGTETSISRLQLLYDAHGTSVEIMLSICPLSVSTHSEEYFSSSKEHLLPQQSLQRPPRLYLPQWIQTVWVPTLRSSVDQENMWQAENERMTQNPKETF